MPQDIGNLLPDCNFLKQSASNQEKFAALHLSTASNPEFFKILKMTELQEFPPMTRISKHVPN